MPEEDHEIREKAGSLIAATKELLFQIEEKEKRTAELIIANRELAFQNEERAKRAAELVIANEELAFQNEEKEKRAAELAIANKELTFQNAEKEKRATELIAANKSLQAFNYITSHDLQEPLRKIVTFGKLILETENGTLSEKGKDYLQRMMVATARMQELNGDLLVYANVNDTEPKFEETDLNIILDEVKKDLSFSIEEKKAKIEILKACKMSVVPGQFYQLMSHLMSNSIKFSRPNIPPHVVVQSKMVQGSELNVPGLSPSMVYCHVSVTDNGIGFEPQYEERIFDLFKRLHSNTDYEGTGIGLALVKKIVENHNGIITATSELSKGARFDVYLPAAQ